MESNGNLQGKRIPTTEPLPKRDNGNNVRGFVFDEANLFKSMTHTTTLPTEEEIDETLQKINDILEKPEIDTIKNKSVREGYDLAAHILAEDLREVKEVDFSPAKSVQARVIAFLAIDYLNGECEQKVLLNVPLK